MNFIWTEQNRHPPFEDFLKQLDFTRAEIHQFWGISNKYARIQPFSGNLLANAVSSIKVPVAAFSGS
jgi:hypothetical protein